MIDNRNMILAVVLSIAILVGFEMFFTKPQIAPSAENQIQQNQAFSTNKDITKQKLSGPQTPQSLGIISSPATSKIPNIPATGQVKPRFSILKQSPRIEINTSNLHGTISLLGGRIDDLTLANYRETLDPNSDEIVLLIPKGDPKAYYAEFGWVSADKQRMPGPDTLWETNDKSLSPDNSVTLSWDNKQGLKFFRTFSVDDKYMFTITQTVSNTGREKVTIFPYGLISRRTTPEVSGFYIIHEGLMGVGDSTLKEIDYSELQELGQVQGTTTGGWLGITDKYWMTALVPDQNTEIKTRYYYHKEGDADIYQVDYLANPLSIPPGAKNTVENRLFAGAKQVSVMDTYKETLHIDRFDLTIDFGWFYFLTKPIFYALLYLNNIVQNFGVSIILLTVFIKLVFFPLANKSYTSMSKMKKLAPQMTALRERFGDDKQRLNQEMMELYKREKVNPASGCLPILIQIPVFFALYKVLFVNIEMRQAPFFGWIEDLSAPDPTSLFNLFGLIPWAPPDFLIIGIWPLIMGVSMYLQQKLNPQPADPMQAKIFQFLPIMFTFLLARFPAGLVIYWAVNNVLSMGQQWIIMKRMGISTKDALK